MRKLKKEGPQNGKYDSITNTEAAFIIGVSIGTFFRLAKEHKK